MRLDVVVNGQTVWLDELKAALRAQSRSLGIRVSVKSVSPGQVAANSSLPLVYFLAADGPRGGEEHPSLDRAVKHGRFILPVCEAAVAASRLPKALKPINAFLCRKYGRGWPDALADEILSHLWVGRSARKVFISYKRSDSAAVAKQLHDRFVALQFDAFLDDCSIPRGVDFQRELMFWLNDADLVVLLVTPNLANSEWVLEEIEFAKSAQIGILTVVWPQVASVMKRQGKALLKEILDRLVSVDRCQLRRRELPAPRGDLSRAGLERVVQLTLRARIDSLVRRLHHLLPAARDTLSSGERIVVSDGKRLGDLIAEGGGERVLARVLPYRPALRQFHELYQAGQRENLQPDSIGCFYPENDPFSPAAMALRWALERQEEGDPVRRVWRITD